MAVATTSRASADATAVAFGAHAAYDDPRSLIRAADVHIVSVCVRAPYHRDLVLAALAARTHVYCEWPLGRDAPEAAEMAANVQHPGKLIKRGDRRHRSRPPGPDSHPTRTAFSST